MQLYLVHHGEAVPPSVDPQRPLSEGGRVNVERVAQRAATKGVVPAIIWHSGKLRARQTAEVFRQVCNTSAEFSAARGLQPTDPPDWMVDKLASEALANHARDIMVVGHMPHIQGLLCLLVERTSEGTTSFPEHGMVALEMRDSGWVERWNLDG